MTAETTPPFGVAQKPWGWAPLVCAGPLTTSLRGLWVSGLLPPGNGGTCSRGGDPRTDQVTQGADSQLPGWQPKENASKLPQQGGTLKSALVATAQQVVEEPRPLASRRHCLYELQKFTVVTA